MRDLHLWKLTLDTRAVSEFAKQQRLLHRETDHGYVIHAALAAALGSAAPSPFVIERSLSPAEPQAHELGEVVLAYSDQALDSVVRSETPAHRSLVRWDRSASKRVPFIASGTRLAFSTRVLPTVRTHAPSPGETERSKGREVDAFVAECIRRPDAVIDRSDVYRGWLARRLAGESGQATGGADLEEFSLQQFRRVRVLRKEAAAGEGRRRHVLERPDALMTGTLLVKDAAAFRALLHRGVGRHRSFGFGMVLLRRAS